MTDNAPIIRQDRIAGSLLMDPVRLERTLVLAERLALSPLIPQHLRGPKDIAVANFVLCMNIAERLKEDPIAVMQSIFFVNGTPGWKASYMISRANQSGVFKGPIRWRSTGEGVDLEVTAYAKMADDGEVVEIKVSMNMAKLEGWTKNTKYASMPEQMLRYRAATFLIRLYCPEVMLGYQTVEEIEDISAARAKDITPHDPDTGEVIEPTEDRKPKGKTKPTEDVEDAKVVDEEEVKNRKDLQKKHREAQKGKKPEPTAKAEPEPEPEPDDSEAFDANKVPDELQGPFDQISSSIRDCNQIGDIEGLVELFRDALDHMAEVYPPAREELQRIEDERREELASES